MSESHNDSSNTETKDDSRQNSSGGQAKDDSNRKRKNDDNSNGGNKRSNKDSSSDDNEVHFKLLIPSSAAGGVIGRGGERIGQIQKDASVRIKMSKNNEYYPNTSERICMVTGTVKSVLRAHTLILERIQEKPEMSGDSERANQIRFLIPNSTAGLLIGKGGSYIKQIKDDSGAFVQISSKQTDLPERIVTIEGDENKRNKALQIIVKKISEDPQHNSVSTLNYSTLQSSSGGSANSSQQHMQPSGFGGSGGGGGFMHDQFSNNSSMNQDNSQSGGNKFDFNSAAYYLSGLNNLALLIINCGGSFQMTSDTLKLALRNAGYSSSASIEILDAITVLMSYGLITKISPAALLAANPSLASLINLGPAGLANITSALAASMMGGNMSNMGGGGNQFANALGMQQQQQGGGGGSGGGHHHQQQMSHHQQQMSHHHHQQSSGGGGGNFNPYYQSNGSSSGSNGLHHLGKANKK